jgi:hypothetical protein
MATPITDGNRLERLQQRGARVRREVSGLTGEVEEALTDLERLVREQLERRPYATLGAATGLGYLLGGGLPLGLSRLMFGLGGRMAFVMMAQKLAASLGEGAAGGAEGAQKEREA